MNTAGKNTVINTTDNKNGRGPAPPTGPQARIAVQSAQSIDALLGSLGASHAGFTGEQAKKLLDEHGENIITTDTGSTVLHRLRKAVINPFNMVLLAIAGVSFFTDVILAPAPDYLTCIIILSLVTASGLVAFVQGERSNSAAEKLSNMISNRTAILRDGMFAEIPMAQVVPGDIVRLSAGDMLPADLRFLTTKDTFVSQAALTGESGPIEKFAEQPAKEGALTDLPNIGFMGSNIVSGSATAVILSTGNGTYLASMAHSLSGTRSKNSFEKGVDSVSRLLLRMMLIMVPIVFLVNGLIKGDWTSALLFSVTVAVGLTPEMLPVIMTSTLASGAVKMSGHEVIVRSLSAIQTFGEMDILCTDKTGTLTEDKIVLEKYMDISGRDDRRVLRHAYLNSHFQTGLKNLIDLAIISRAENYDMQPVLARYELIDEIPFDFSRRRMSVVLRDETGKRQLITKGAVEEMMDISPLIEIDGEVHPMSDDLRAAALRTYDRHNRDGLRMIAVAQRDAVPDRGAFSVADERDMVLIGFVGFLDPPKADAGAAITALEEHGVRTVVLTGDSEGVAIKVCSKVGISTGTVLTGMQVQGMTDGELAATIPHCNLYAKLSPSQKVRVVEAFQAQGHTVGYMGDGINDAQALRHADVGISVDSAVDIAKESADIILLKKDLMVLEQGVIAGRQTFGNIIKYIKMAASGNFGNIISVVLASVFLPFLPMLPVQLLTQNLLCDFSQMGIPFDSVDDEYLKKPRRWETTTIRRFMFTLGPISSLFDILCFLVLYFVMGANSIQNAQLFWSGWFMFGTVSQVLIIHMIRTSKIPFVISKPAGALVFSTLLVTVVALVVGFTPLAVALDMAAQPPRFAPWLVLLLAGYMFAVQAAKAAYIKRYGEWM